LPRIGNTKRQPQKLQAQNLKFFKSKLQDFPNPQSSVFQHFCAAEPSATVCFAHGTLCNDPSIYPAVPSLANEFRHGQFRSVSAESLSATIPEPWGYAEPQFKNTAAEGLNNSIAQSTCELLCCKIQQENLRTIRLH